MKFPEGWGKVWNITVGSKSKYDDRGKRFDIGRTARKAERNGLVLPKLSQTLFRLFPWGAGRCCCARYWRYEYVPSTLSATLSISPICHSIQSTFMIAQRDGDLRTAPAEVVCSQQGSTACYDGRRSASSCTALDFLILYHLHMRTLDVIHSSDIQYVFDLLS